MYRASIKREGSKINIDICLLRWALSSRTSSLPIVRHNYSVTTNKLRATDECRLAKQQSARLVNSGAAQRGC